MTDRVGRPLVELCRPAGPTAHPGPELLQSRPAAPRQPETGRFCRSSDTAHPHRTPPQRRASTRPVPPELCRRPTARPTQTHAAGGAFV